MTDIVIVDDHPIVSEGLAQLIHHKSDGRLNVVGIAENAEDALRIIPELNPDIIIVDLFLKGSTGIELIKRIKSQMPKMKTLMLSMHDEAFYAGRAIKAGASGYIMKQESGDEIIKAIDTVLNGQVYISSRMAVKLLRRKGSGSEEGDDMPINTLADRELEVFQMFGMGWTTRRIAEELDLSVKTVETYCARIKEKLELNNSNELIQQAVQWVTGKSSMQ
jgi:DNA-binding NarL/FixJ family response regulator